MAAEKRRVVEAVVITATISLFIAGIIAYFVYRFVIARRIKKNGMDSSFRREPAAAAAAAGMMMPRVEFRQHGRALRGVIVDEEGMDVLYLSRFEGSRVSDCFPKLVYNNPLGEELKRMDSRREKPIQEVPLLKETNSNGYDFSVKDSVPVPPPPPPPGPPKVKPVPPTPPLAKKGLISQQKPPVPPPPPPSLPLGYLKPPPPPPGPPKVKPVPPTPPPAKKGLISQQKPPVPPPPPPSLPLGYLKPPPPPPGPPKVKPVSPTPPPAKKGLISQQKPPVPPPNGIAKRNAKSKKSSMENENGGAQTRLKPLHWDKVTANADHSMVWNEINDGSFRFDDDLIESLFGFPSAAQKSTEKSSGQGSSNSVPPPAQIFLLDPRKSQNTAIVLKSLLISRKEILDALHDGRGLSVDTLEKLTKICPTQDEVAKILQFSGNHTKLADAESFLYHILRSVPSAFVRFNAMLFRSSYDSEILQLKESLQTLELGCKELRRGGIFFKLLEAILKAGNRMNAGTARGNAQGFNLSALQRLSEVKSSDGKTTLLHFVVEQVMRSEGKRHLISRKNRQDSDPKSSRDEEYLMLGLPVVGKLSAEFANVKRAAAIDYDNFINTCSNLTARVNESRQLLTHCRDELGRFLEEMKGFLEDCEEELKVMNEEETRVMELMRKTTTYYQAGAFQEKGTDPLQFFVIVKNFLVMVDQVCAEIAKKLERHKVMSTCPSPPLSPTPTSPMRFQNLKAYLMSQHPGTNSSDSEDDF